MYITQTADRAVDHVLTLAGTVNAAGDRDLFKIQFQFVVGVIQCDRYEGKTKRFTIGRTCKDDIFHLRSTELFDLLLAKYPADRIRYVTLT